MHQKCKVHDIRSQQINIAPKTCCGCTCRDKNNSPLDKKWLAPQIVYQADITNNTDGTYKYYLGLAETSFKDRYRTIYHILNIEQQKNITELSKYVWSLKNENKTPIINWKIMRTI